MSTGNDDGQDWHRCAFASAGFGEGPICDDPFFDLRAWKQKLAGDATYRQRSFRCQFIDLSLSDTEHRGKLSGRKELHHLFCPM